MAFRPAGTRRAPYGRASCRGPSRPTDPSAVRRPAHVVHTCLRSNTRRHYHPSTSRVGPPPRRSRTGSVLPSGAGPAAGAAGEQRAAGWPGSLGGRVPRRRCLASCQHRREGRTLRGALEGRPSWVSRSCAARWRGSAEPRPTRAGASPDSAAALTTQPVTFAERARSQRAGS